VVRYGRDADWGSRPDGDHSRIEFHYMIGGTDGIERTRGMYLAERPG
jgi:hypothetical protein